MIELIIVVYNPKINNKVDPEIPGKTIAEMAIIPAINTYKINPILSDKENQENEMILNKFDTELILKSESSIKMAFNAVETLKAVRIINVGASLLLSSLQR